MFEVGNKILPERETRRRLLKHAREIGCEKDMMLIFIEADKLLRNCTNEKERKDIGKIYAMKVYFLLGGGGDLTIDGEIVYKTPE